MPPTFTNIIRLRWLERRLELIPGARARYLCEDVRRCLRLAEQGKRFRAETVDQAEAFVAD